MALDKELKTLGKKQYHIHLKPGDIGKYVYYREIRHVQTVLQNIWIMLNLLLKTENIVHLQDIIKG